MRGLKLAWLVGWFRLRTQSHLTQVRGLKQAYIVIMAVFGLVAPHAGAWIETCRTLMSAKYRLSHLTQVRGLKQ